MNNPFEQYIHNDDSVSEIDMNDINQALDQLMEGLLDAILRATHADERLISLLHKLIANGCPPDALMKTLLEMGKEDHDE